MFCQGNCRWSPASDALPVPATSIYSRYDGIVAWQACLDVPSARAENIAVVGSHLGFGYHPAVIWAVADRLAQPLGEWAPFRPPAALRPLFPTRGHAPLARLTLIHRTFAVSPASA